MHTPTAAQLLDAWEGAITASPVRRALTLVALAQPARGLDELAAMPVGRRDRLLMELRAHLFGTRLELVAHCPACRQLLEMTLRTTDFEDGLSGPDGARAATGGAAPPSIERDGYRIAFRVPNSADLLALPVDADPELARALLLQRCVLEIHGQDGDPAPLEQVPVTAIDALVEAMSGADPAADVELAFICPACEHRWNDMFDIGGFLWQELHAWAQRTVREVHELARAYGWREADVLALSPARRLVYLELSRL